MALSDKLKYLKSRIDLRTLMVCSALGFSACTSNPTVLPTPRLVYTCPSVPTYTQETLDKANAETMEHSNDVPTLVNFVEDYLSLRDAIRKCHYDAAVSLSNIKQR